jgi:hypothetical protein
MIEADSTVRKTVALLMASFQINDPAASRLQCSVARIAAACGPSACSLASTAAAEPALARSGTPHVTWALLESAVAIADLLGLVGDGSPCVAVIARTPMPRVRRTPTSSTAWARCWPLL